MHQPKLLIKGMEKLKGWDWKFVTTLVGLGITLGGTMATVTNLKDQVAAMQQAFDKQREAIGGTVTTVGSLKESVVAMQSSFDQQRESQFQLMLVMGRVENKAQQNTDRLDRIERLK